MELALYINKYITDILTNNEQITSLVQPVNIQPLVLEPTDFPFISFARIASTTEYNKGYSFVDEVTHDLAEVEFAIVTENYSDSIKIATALRSALECQRYINKEDGIAVEDIHLLATSEQKDNAYIQYMLFNFTIRKI